MGKTKEAAGAENPAAADAKALGKALWTKAKEVIDMQINGDRKHGWGVKDSMAAIEEVVALDAELSKAESVQKFTLSDEALRIVEFFVNPSACRQKLEDPKGLNRLDRSDSKRTSVDFDKEFGS